MSKTWKGAMAYLARSLLNLVCRYLATCARACRFVYDVTGLPVSWLTLLVDCANKLVNLANMLVHFAGGVN